MFDNWFLRSIGAVFLLSASVDLIRPMVSYRALDIGASTSEIGFLAASYAVLSFLVAVPTGQWVDRFGETRFVMFGGLLMAGTALWLAVATSVLLLGVAQALLGAGQIFGLVAIQTLVANCSPATERDARFGAFAVMGSLGQVAGPALGGGIASLSNGSPEVALLTSTISLLAFAAVGVSLHRWPPPSNDRHHRTPRSDAALRAMVRVLRIPSMPQAMIASLTVLATIDILVAYVPVYGEANGISVGTVGLLLAGRAAASALSRLTMVALIRWLGRRRLFILGLVIPAVALAFVPTTTAVGALGLLLALAGFGLGLGQPMSLAWVTTAAPADTRGLAIGVRLMGNRAGQIALPAAVGLVGGSTGVGAIFVALGMLLGASAGAVTTARFSDDRAT